MGAVVGGVLESTAARSALERCWSALPDTIFARQGCRLELLGVCWAMERASWRRGRGTGVERKERVECRFRMRLVRDLVHCGWCVVGEWSFSFLGFVLVILWFIVDDLVLDGWFAFVWQVIVSCQDCPFIVLLS